MSQPLWHSSEIIKACNGKALGADFTASSVSIDSRTVERNALFVAICGEHMDGHQFVLDAITKKGAAAALVSRVPEGAEDFPLILVEDTTTALEDLARAARARSDACFIGVTGSVGKTTTKEMLAHVLSAHGAVYATKGNLNNHYGVPLTLANLPKGLDYAVIEMGMNHANEITPLTKMAHPHIALITSIAAVHIEFFDSVSAIADAKAEIFQGLDSSGVAIIGGVHEYKAQLTRSAQQAHLSHIVHAGAMEHDAVRLCDYHIEDGKAHAAIVTPDGVTHTVLLGILGRQHAVNAASVIAVLDQLELSFDRHCLEHFTAPKGRGKMVKGRYTIIDESYNASPVSVDASIALLGSMKSQSSRVVAVLGDMLELGNDSATYHKALASAVLDYDIDAVYTVGPLMKHLHDALPKEICLGHADSAETACKVLPGLLCEGDVVLVKGSRGIKCDKIVDCFV